MKLGPTALNLFAALLACFILLAAPATAAERDLPPDFDYTVPNRGRATVGESLGFAAIVVGVLAVASVNTYFKVRCGCVYVCASASGCLAPAHHNANQSTTHEQVKASPKLPGYTQAVYLRERDNI